MLDRCGKAMERRCKDFARQSPSERHRLRIALKKLRYTAELFAGLYPASAIAEFTQRLKHLQDGLGRANDVHIGETLVHELAEVTAKDAGVAISGRQVLEWHKQRLSRGEKKIREDLRCLKQAKPFWRA